MVFFQKIGIIIAVQCMLITWISAQQGQNFFFQNTAGQQSQFLPQFQQQSFIRDEPSSSQYSNFFPRTNSGPFSPYRATVPSYQDEDLQTSDIPSQFPQIQGFSIPTTYQLPPRNPPSASLSTFDNTSPVRTTANTQSRQQNYQDTNFRQQLQSFGSLESPAARQEQSIRNVGSEDKFKLTNNFKNNVPSNPRTTQSFVNVQHPQGIVDSLSTVPRNRWRTAAASVATKTEPQTSESEHPFSSEKVVPVGTRIPIPVKNIPRENLPAEKDVEDYEFDDNSAPPESDPVFLRPLNIESSRSENANRVKSNSRERTSDTFFTVPSQKPEKIGKTPQEIHESHTRFINNRPELRFRPSPSSISQDPSTISPTTQPKPQQSKFRFNPSSRERNSPQSKQPQPSTTSPPKVSTNRGLSRFSPTKQSPIKSSAEVKEQSKEQLKVNRKPSKSAEEEIEEGEEDEFYDDEESQFDVLPMHKDQTLVSDDNFREFVDSGSIDIDTPQLSNEENKDTSEERGRLSVSVHSSITTSKRPTAAPQTTPDADVKTEKMKNVEIKKEQPKSTSRQTITSKASTPTTESWVIVASVQTSRSVSGARFLPSGAIKQEEQIQPLLPKGSSEVKTESNIEHTITEGKEEVSSVKSTTETSTESIIDKLDRVQSELSSGILVNGFHSETNKQLQVPDLANEKQDKQSTTTTTTTATSTTSTTAITSTATTAKATVPTEEVSTVFERKFSPSAAKFTTSARPSTSKKKSSLLDNIQFDDLSGLLPPGFKPRSRKPITTTTEEPKVEEKEKSDAKPEGEEEKTKNDKSKNKKNDGETRPKGILSKIKFDDISSFLPPGYKPSKESESSSSPLDDILSKVKPVDISNFLPTNFTTTTSNPSTKSNLESLISKIQFKDASALLPPGLVLNSTSSEPNSEEKTNASEKSSTMTSTTKKPSRAKNGGVLVLQPKIQRGWPQRSTTEFTGWPTPPTTPISVEKLIEAARSAASSTQKTEPPSTEAPTTTTTTTTTTTPAPTTPGYCVQDCDLAATIKLVGGVKWAPELLDRNTKEWKTLEDEVKHQLEILYSTSEGLSRWYKKITIDAFSEGSVLVDYFVELNELGRSVSTADLKRLFHESLLQAQSSTHLKEISQNEPLQMGTFMVDPKHIDFVVLPKQNVPKVAMAEEDMWLPQWAIAVTVVALGSLLFVVIFGVTVLVSRSKKAKKQPTAMTEDMLHELNKNHMTGVDNYGADDLYNMEDVWNDTNTKKRSSYETSMSNLYDSWRSDWHGYSHYYDGSSHSGYTHRPPRSDYLSRHPDYDNDF